MIFIIYQVSVNVGQILLRFYKGIVKFSESVSSGYTLPAFNVNSLLTAKFLQNVCYLYENYL